MARHAFHLRLIAYGIGAVLVIVVASQVSSRQDTASTILAGTVTDASTGAPITGALVFVSNGGNLPPTYTDEAGQYCLRGVPADVTQMRVRHPGYVERRVPIKPMHETSVRVAVRLRTTPRRLRGHRLDEIEVILGKEPQTNEAVTSNGETPRVMTPFVEGVEDLGRPESSGFRIERTAVSPDRGYEARSLFFYL